ncbi:MAG: hypothetical protein ACXQTJ_04665 [Candidatus Syntropharchaeales archaeon]|uniref:Uncharacterized protein n=1 Tax=Candidatus Syntropharchaeum caldarium TaxID=1838285 RepID=A0A1F2PAV6_9EURY|nr:MAG: hypothetical protein SCAL_001141 [Candidatus Syntrophoarchaeum caldarius]
MIDRELVKEFLKEEMEYDEIELPEGISFDELADLFCKYVEDDFYEWLKDNYRSFFRNGWDWIKERLAGKER